MISNHTASCVGLIVLLTTCTAGCGGAAPHRPAAPQVAQAVRPEAPAAPDGPAAAFERKIIYTSQIDVVVADMTAAQKELEGLIKSVQEAGGYLAKQEVTGRTGYHRQSSWTIRVPLSRYDGFVAAVEKLGELQRNSREAQDVTEAYADLDARLRNKQASERRLLSHLEKTGELKDTLEVERELSRVRSEIEQMQGQLNVLKNKTDLATVMVTLFEQQSYTPPTAPSFSTLVTRTFNNSVQSLKLCGQALVLIIVALAPWSVVAALLAIPVWIGYRIRSRSKRPDVVIDNAGTDLK